MSTIKICDAKDWVKKWQEENKSHAKAFLIPAVDLIDCLIEMAVLTKKSDGNYFIKKDLTDSSVRAYMAIERPANEKPSALTEKLLLVGTLKDKKGIHKDLVINKVCPETTEEKEEAIKGSGVYDFTTPCPDNCDPTSPLYKP
ncbi:hypothetical protein [Lacinutrix sp. MEBiC02404]